jgi:phage terminase small subunit
MARGGYRPGSGRKKGSKSKGEIINSEEKAQIEEMLSFSLKAKSKIYADYLNRVKKGEKVSLTEKRLMEKIEAELKSAVSGNKPEKHDNETPLEYMLRVMNDPKVDSDMRARMATAAAPYVHQRQGEGMGKKEEQDERAKKAGAGRFAPGRAPLKAVK